MTIVDQVTIVGAVAAMLTAISSGGATLFFWSRRTSDIKKLEKYLKNAGEVAASEEKSMLHLIRHVRLTEQRIMDAAINSRHILLLNRKDADGFANMLLFKYTKNLKRDEKRERSA
jgi:hypothetical protein